MLSSIFSSEATLQFEMDVKGELLRSASNSSTPSELQSLPLTPPLGGHQNPSQYEFF